jgi:hypothetical protein
MGYNSNKPSNTTGEKYALNMGALYAGAVLFVGLIGLKWWFTTRPIICPDEDDWLNWGSKVVCGEVVAQEPGKERPSFYYWKVRQGNGDFVNFYPLFYRIYKNDPIEIGDSLFKEAGSFDVVLVKKGQRGGTTFPFICPEGSTPFVPKGNGR